MQALFKSVKSGKRRDSKGSKGSKGKKGGKKSKGPKKSAPPAPDLPPGAILDFSLFLTDKTKSFVGRKSLFATVHKWRQTGAIETTSSPSNVVLLKGDPGLGKTAFLAALVTLKEHKNHVIAHHFCRYDDPPSLDPRRFLLSIMGQLLKWLSAVPATPEEVKKLNVERILEDTAGNVVDQFYGLIESLPREIKSLKEPVLLVVDSLDEAHDAGGRMGDQIVRALGKASSALPSWLRIIASTRKDESVLAVLEKELHAVTLDAADAENMADVRVWLTTLDKDTFTPKLIERIIASSQGNWLFVRQMALDIEANGLVFDEADELPQGLRALYAARARHIWKSEKEWRHALPILEVLVASVAAVPLFLLQSAVSQDKARFGTGPPDAEAVVKALSSVLALSGDGRVRIYHKSFADWAEEEGWCESLGESIPCDRIAGHSRLAKASLREWAAERPSQYVVSNIITHALASENPSLIEQTRESIGTNWAWMNAKQELDGLTSLANALISLENLSKRIGKIIRAWSFAGRRAVCDGLAVSLLGVEGAEGLLADLRSEVAGWPLVPQPMEAALDRRLVGHRRPVTLLGIGVSKTSTQALVSEDTSAATKFWDPTTGDLEDGYRIAPLTGLCYSADGTAVLKVKENNRLELWSLTQSGVIWRTAAVSDYAVVGVSLASDGGFVTGHRDGSVYWWKTKQLNKPTRLREVIRTSWATSISAVPGRHDAVVIGFSNGHFAGYHLREYRGPLQLWSLAAWEYPITCIAFHDDDGSQLVLGCHRILSWFSISSWEEIYRPKSQETVKLKRRTRMDGIGTFVCMAVSRDRSILATGHRDSKVRVWTQYGDAPIAVLSGHTGTVKSITLLPSGQIASGGEDGQIIIWDVEQAARDKKMYKGVLDPRERVLKIVALSDGTVVSGHGNGMLKVYEPIQDGQAPKVIAALHKHTESITTIVPLPDGGFLSAAADSWVKWWKKGSDGKWKLWYAYDAQKPVWALATDIPRKRVFFNCGVGKTAELSLEKTKEKDDVSVGNPKETVHFPVIDFHNSSITQHVPTHVLSQNRIWFEGARGDAYVYESPPAPLKRSWNVIHDLDHDGLVGFIKSSFLTDKYVFAASDYELKRYPRTDEGSSVGPGVSFDYIGAVNLLASSGDRLLFHYRGASSIGYFDGSDTGSLVRILLRTPTPIVDAFWAGGPAHRLIVAHAEGFSVYEDFRWSDA